MVVARFGGFLIQSCPPGVAVVRGDLADEEWKVVGALLPLECGR